MVVVLMGDKENPLKRNILPSPGGLSMEKWFSVEMEQILEGDFSLRLDGETIGQIERQPQEFYQVNLWISTALGPSSAGRVDIRNLVVENNGKKLGLTLA